MRGRVALVAGASKGIGAAAAEAFAAAGIVLPIDGGQAAGNKPPQMYRPGQPMQAQPAAG